MRDPRLFALALFPLLLAAAAPLQTLPPPAPTSAAANRAAGAKLFRETGCQQCHGPVLAGTDDGPAIKDVGKALSRKAIEYRIKRGGGGMPPFEDILTPAELQQLLDFLEAHKLEPAT